MSITRDFNNRFFGSNDTQELTLADKNWYTLASDGVPYEFSGPFSLVRRHHQIVATDYDNYAIAYGCDNILGGMFHLRWSNLLSREPYLQYEYVRTAKEKVVAINYDWDFWWLKSGKRCGYIPAPTQDDVMIEVFDTIPDWTPFVPESAKTQRTMMLFAEPGKSDLPHGFITGPLQYGTTINIQTGLAHQIWESDF